MNGLDIFEPPYVHYCKNASAKRRKLESFKKNPRSLGRCADLPFNVIEQRFITRDEYLRIVAVDADCYFSIGGRIISHPADVEDVQDALIQVHPRLRGGKGGFGSMLRAIGNQIEKTNNHDMCRDLSGRRMRDVTAEAKLKEWYSKAGERERAKVDRYLEKQRRRREALDKGFFHDHKFNDPEFAHRKEQISSELQNAVEEMLARIADDARSSEPVKKKSKLWIEKLDEGSSSSGNDTSDESADSDVLPSSSLSNKDKRPSSYSSPSAKSEADSGTLLSEDNATNAQEREGESKRNEDENKTKLMEVTETSNSSPVSSGKAPINPSLSICITEVELNAISSVTELESYGLEALKHALSSRGLKCGGTLSERAARLFSVRGLEPSRYPVKLLAKSSKK